MPEDSQNMLRVRPGRLEFQEITLCEELRALSPKIQRLPNGVEFDTAILPMLRQFAGERSIWLCLPFQRRQHGRAFRKIDRLAVVRIDQTQVPQLGPLIKVRNSW